MSKVSPTRSASHATRIVQPEAPPRRVMVQQGNLMVEQERSTGEVQAHPKVMVGPLAFVETRIEPSGRHDSVSTSKRVVGGEYVTDPRPPIGSAQWQRSHLVDHAARGRHLKLLYATKVILDQSCRNFVVVVQKEDVVRFQNVKPCVSSGALSWTREGYNL